MCARDFSSLCSPGYWVCTTEIFPSLSHEYLCLDDKKSMLIVQYSLLQLKDKEAKEEQREPNCLVMKLSPVETRQSQCFDALIERRFMGPFGFWWDG